MFVPPAIRFSEYRFRLTERGQANRQVFGNLARPECRGRAMNIMSLKLNLSTMDSPDIPRIFGTNLKETWVEFWISNTYEKVKLLGRDIKCTIDTPMVLNTSFNVRAESIVETPADAVRSFLESEIDALVFPAPSSRKGTQ